ncbi:DUF2254 domain-containing protein [Mycobacterium sp. WMMD1722]|uniref:DUF2254 domain-containing protein n=1 Tax=Mycobacterium sp. WMMD1722 TaxID=3404117 RepID=UPI003BF55B35
MMPSRAGIADAVHSRLWPIPMLALLSALVLGIAMPSVDEALDTWLPTSVAGFLFGGGADAAREVLSAIASSLITVTSLTFSLTLVTLQLASSQYSPRLLRTFAADRVVHRTLGLFLGTFMYALTVLRTIRSNDETGDFVPRLAVTVAYLLTVLSVVMLVAFLAHLVKQIRIEAILDQVRTDTVSTASRVFERNDDDDAHEPVAAAVVPTGRAEVIESKSSGFLVEIDAQTLRDVAVDADVVVWVDKPVGSAVTAGTPIARCWPKGGAPLDDETVRHLQQQVTDALRTGRERTSAHDAEFGLRQLVDVVIRALSPGINDPTTAVHGLHSCTLVLSDLLTRRLGRCTLVDDDGRVRVVVDRPTFRDLLELVCRQPRVYGAGDPAVLEALMSLLRDLAWQARSEEHRSAIVEQLDVLREPSPGQTFALSADRMASLRGEVLSAFRLDAERRADAEGGRT